MTQQSLQLKIKGLYTHPSELSEVPEGALSVAKNINIDQESVARPRRGMDRYDYAFGSSLAPANKIFEYRDALLVHYGTDKLARDTGTAFTDYAGSYEAPDASTPVRATRANQNFYFTTSTGVKKLDAIDATPRDVGMPKAISMDAELIAGDILAVNHACAYRHLWARKDANNNLTLGAPSQRLVVINPSGGGNAIRVTLEIPDGIAEGDFVQLYRSANVADTIEPSDELQLVYEASPTSAEITAKQMVIDDITPIEIAGATIYTAPSQETITAANEPPPFAKDIALYKGHMFYLNTKSRHRFQFTLLAADGSGSPGTEALQADDEIVINGVTYTAKGATDVDQNEFKVSDAASVATAIRETSLELIRVINKSASNVGANAVYAYYLSGVNDTPGKILIESRSVGGAQFSLTYSEAATRNPFQPQLPVSGTSASSQNDRFVNAVQFSKNGQPEAVPLSNVFRVGSADSPGSRILALRNSLFILKDDGVFRVTGEDAGSFRVDLFDNTARIRAPESAVVLNNAIYFLSDQGVAQCTETGISIMSRPIENRLLETFSFGLSNVAKYTFGVSYESERKYILGTIQANTDTAATIYYVYNTFTNAWTTWEDIPSKAGLVKDDDDKLYLTSPTSNFLRTERKVLNETDYADFRVVSTISAVDGLTLTITNTDQIEPGDVVFQSSSKFSVVDEVDSIAGTATVLFEGGLEPSTVTIYRAVDSIVEWVPFHGGNPGISKHFGEVSFLFKKTYALKIIARFSSDISQAIEQVEIDAPSFGNWGFFTWGGIPWGGSIGRRAARTWVPLEKQRCSLLSAGLRQRIGFSDYELYGISVLWQAGNKAFTK